MNTKEDIKRDLDEMISLKNVKREEFERMKQEVINLNNVINENYKKLEHMKRYENIQVSDHAIVRWMERKHGINFDTIREEILTERILRNILEIKEDGTYERRVVKNGVIVTVLKI